MSKPEDRCAPEHCKGLPMPAGNNSNVRFHCSGCPDCQTTADLLSEAIAAVTYALRLVKRIEEERV